MFRPRVFVSHAEPDDQTTTTTGPLAVLDGQCRTIALRRMLEDFLAEWLRIAEQQEQQEQRLAAELERVCVSGSNLFDSEMNVSMSHHRYTVLATMLHLGYFTPQELAIYSEVNESYVRVVIGRESQHLEILENGLYRINPASVDELQRRVKSLQRNLHLPPLLFDKPVKVYITGQSTAADMCLDSAVSFGWTISNLSKSVALAIGISSNALMGGIKFHRSTFCGESEQSEPKLTLSLTPKSTTRQTARTTGLPSNCFRDVQLYSRSEDRNENGIMHRLVASLLNRRFEIQQKLKIKAIAQRLLVQRLTHMRVLGARLQQQIHVLFGSFGNCSSRLCPSHPIG